MALDDAFGVPLLFLPPPLVLPSFLPPPFLDLSLPLPCAVRLAARLLLAARLPLAALADVVHVHGCRAPGRSRGRG